VGRGEQRRRPTSASATTPSYAALNANGTGPFKVESHQPGVKTVWKPNTEWWNEANKQHNLTEAIFTPIGSDATRVAALLSGEVDWIDPVPLQDMQRVNQNPNTQVLTGPELRTIHLGFDQKRDELKYSNVKGKNPFKDVRVREAFQKAIDLQVIKDRGHARRLGAERAHDLAAPDAGRFGRAVPAGQGGHRRSEEAPHRGRLPERLRGHDGLPERSLRQ
jgi:ABC-type transport system substrate-binding protein